LLLSQFDVLGSSSYFSADSTVKRSGSYSMKVLAASTSNYAQKKAYTNPPTNSTYGTTSVARFAFRMTAPLPTNNTPYVGFIASAGGTGYLYYRPSTNRLAVTFDGTSFGDANVALLMDTWYLLEFRVSVGGSTRTMEWRIDGAAQPSVSKVVAASFIDSIQFTGGPTGTGAVWYDDIFMSATSTDYPIGDGRIERLVPDGMGPGFGNPGSGTTFFQNNDNTAVDSNSWTRLDEIPPTTADYVKKVSGTTTANYVDITFQNTTETCINGVAGTMAYGSSATNQSNLVVTSLVDNGTARVIDQGSRSGGGSVLNHTRTGVAQPATAPWSQAAVNGLIGRFTATDVAPIPYLEQFILEYDVNLAGTPPPEGAAGTETGATASTTAANAGIACGNPTQLDGRPCSYAREDYTTAGPPILRTTADLTGSGAGKCTLYKFTPSTAAGSTSYVWGRRTAGSGGAGAIKESAVRYYGTNEFGQLCTGLGIGAGPAGWPGYLVKYDAGSTPAQATAEAGLGSAAPVATPVGTISYWNGSSVSTLAVSTAQQAIPVSDFAYTANGYKVEIITSCTGCGLASALSGTLPVGATGTIDRTDASATVGAPVVGAFQYKVTNVSSGAVLANLRVAVDLGNLAVTAHYAP
jgi:hypothetical protein